MEELEWPNEQTKKSVEKKEQTEYIKEQKEKVKVIREEKKRIAMAEEQKKQAQVKQQLLEKTTKFTMDKVLPQQDHQCKTCWHVLESYIFL